ncbi:hypothetical protein RF11_05612 [Thelohanellus kitauei]|uniref:EGF-like domain-containing protein n=1 Tax=Thelohanellus kitauei TaxID=669202 RepID=A0A0C2I5W6_THEKT|nr:hypothetical protein RF11_05612 [Thelohanellus kitauei]
MLKICIKSICKNNAVCVEFNEEQFCICQENTYGRLCQKSTNRPENNSCILRNTTSHNEFLINATENNMVGGVNEDLICFYNIKSIFQSNQNYCAKTLTVASMILLD